MDQQLQKSDNLAVVDKTSMTHRVVEGVEYGEEVGYDWWYQIELIGGRTYKITPQEFEAIKQAIAQGAKFISLGDDFPAVHQMTGVYKKKNYFGPRAGEA